MIALLACIGIVLAAVLLLHILGDVLDGPMVIHRQDELDVTNRIIWRGRRP